MDYVEIDTIKFFDVGKLKLEVCPNDSQLVFSLYENTGLKKSLADIHQEGAISLEGTIWYKLATAHYNGNSEPVIRTPDISVELRKGLRSKGKKLTKEKTKILDKSVEEALKYYQV